MGNTLRVALTWVCAVGLSACETGGGKPPKVTLPVEAVSALQAGIQVGTIDQQVLQPILSGANGTVVFQHEWRDAPSMTMASINFSQASNADSLLRTFIPNFAPLETEFAVCDSQVVNGAQVEIPPNADGKWASPVFPAGLLGETLSINRVSGELSELRITPDTSAGPGGLFNLSIGIKNLTMGAGLGNFGTLTAPDGYFATFPSIMLSCSAVIQPEALANVTPGQEICGEQNVHCLPGTVIVDIPEPTTNLPWPVPDALWFASQLAAKPVITDLAETGIRLHFEHFAATSLTFADDALGTLRITGTSTVMSDGSSICSPNSPRLPVEPPTRGLMRVLSHDGHGETQSTDGYAREYTIAPWLTAEFVHDVKDGHYQSRSLTNGRLWPTGNFELKAAEFPVVRAFDVSYLSAHLSASKQEEGCWQKRATVSDIEFYGDFTPKFALLEGSFRDPKAIGEFGLREFRAVELRRADPEVVRKAMATLKMGDCGDCSGYWELDGLLAPKGGFGDPWPFPPDDARPFDFPPYDGRLFFGEDPGRRFGDAPWLKCDTKFHPVDKSVIINRPDVWLANSMFDSAQVPSSGFSQVTPSNKFIEGSFQYLGETHRLVRLQDDCWQSGGVCWESRLAAPDGVAVYVGKGDSVTRPPRLDVRDAVQQQLVWQYGQHLVTPWGYFDRGLLDLYSTVPAVYRQAGITQQLMDWRGQSRLDWDHAHGYAAPGSDPNLLLHNSVPVGEQWIGMDGFQVRDTEIFRYRPDFATDSLTMTRRAGTGRSFCTPEAGLISEAKVIIFKPDTQSEVRVPATSIFPATPGTSTVPLVPGAATSGPASPYFDYN